MNCGMEAEIIGYRGSQDIDVRFSDGSIVECKNYSAFITGRIAHPSQKSEFMKSHRIGEKRLMKCGLMAEIVEYRSYRDIDVKFEDGTFSTNKSYGSFSRGDIGFPGSVFREKKMDRIGEIRRINCGLNAEIIEYRNRRDIDVKFEDGEIIRHASYSSFLCGEISHPTVKYIPTRSARIGEQRRMNCGLNAEIIEYRNANDIDIKFEDGVIVKNHLYKLFKIGQVVHPLHSRTHIRKQRVGEKGLMFCGMEAEIIEYTKSSNITIRFSDGAITKNKSYENFKRGAIAHPDLKKGVFHGFTDVKLSFRMSNGRTYYEAFSPDGESGIWTPQQMMAFSPETDTEEPHQERSLHTPCK